MEVSDLNNIELSRIILQRLQGHYSDGGISTRRSLNSFILDLIFPLLTKTLLVSNDLSMFDTFYEYVFLEEAERRIRTCDSADIQLSFESIDMISNTSLVRQLLIHLNCYQLFETSCPLRFRNMVNLVLLIWPVSLKRVYDRDAVIEEASNRVFYQNCYKRINLCNYYPCGLELDRYEEYTVIIEQISDQIKAALSGGLIR